MDSIVHAAVEEVSSEFNRGLALKDLWPKLTPALTSNGLHLCPNLKKAIWTNLLTVPTLQFEAQGVAIDAGDREIQSFEESERLNVKIVAAGNLQSNFLGLYDVKASDAGISDPQNRVLQRLAVARTNGITQSELSKELGVKGNNMFYILRNLECRGLIVRQSTIVRTKEAGHGGEHKSSSIVNTNMLHLYRYAKHLGCQQRLEITIGDKASADNENMDGNIVSAADEGVKEDVCVRDFLPALKAICDKLEQANDKVLVVADIKKDLGYRGTPGHRAWRNICNRLKDARVIEEFSAEVDKKKVICVRLLKSFSPKHFEAKTPGHINDDLDMEQAVKCGRRGQISDQLMELPIEHQIYDMVDAEGSKGLTITEVCKRLGINNKRYYTRLLAMFSRFGMHLESEALNRGVAYRVWTPGNFNPNAQGIAVSKSEKVSRQNSFSNLPSRNLDCNEISAQSTPYLDRWTSKNDVQNTEKSHEEVIDLENDLALVSTSALPNDSLPPLPGLDCSMSPRRYQTPAVPSSISPPETAQLALPAPPRKRSYQKYPCLTLTADSARREQWILQRLQEDKFIITAELRRELESLESGKHGTIDRRTLERCLNKLQKEGLCKLICVSVPVVTNFGRSRTAGVILQPSAEVSPDLLSQIHERLRSFDVEVRAQVSTRLNKDQSVPALDGVERLLKKAKLESQAEKSEAMRANGYVLAKMVRSKLFHIYLWGYLSSRPGWDDVIVSGKMGYDLKNPHSSCELIALDAAIKSMPLELFLQVVGSTEKFEDMISKCRNGLCLSDLPDQEYKCLMNTRATGRLSWIVDILRRLKLLRLVSDGQSEDVANISHPTLTYSMELKPYIEEPVSIMMPTSGVFAFDFRPQIRHDFVFYTRNAVDEYWNTLEYSYSAADSKAASHAFPGSAVPELYYFRSWASVRVMTADQRAELLKRVVSDDPNKKLSLKECEKIAKDLNLTLEQVLRIYHDNRSKRLSRFRGAVYGEGEESHENKKSRTRKRKKSSNKSLGRTENATVDEHPCGDVARLPDTGGRCTEDQDLFLTSGEQEIQLETCETEDYLEEIEQEEPNEEDNHGSSIHECALSRMKPIRQRKFYWTDKADRQLVMEYGRYRAALGAKFHRVDWSSLSNLPAPVHACKRRMTILNRDLKFRKALMKLCNELSERYEKHLLKLQNQPFNQGGCNVMLRDSVFGKGCQRSLPSSDESDGVVTSQELWDDFDDKDIKIALDEVIRYKPMAKHGTSKKVGSLAEEWSDLNTDAEEHDALETELAPTLIPSANNDNLVGPSSGRPWKLSCHRLPRKYNKLLNEGISVNRQAHKSLAVSNAAEFFKLIFLNTATSLGVPKLLADTLRRYSEHDLFAAFNYLRENKIMVGGTAGNPFALSQRFLQSVSSSPFPVNTGKRAAKFSSWLREKEKDLMEEEISISNDLQCGDIFYLCALVSTGELLISPCLPADGIGEAEDSRGSKRKSDDIDFWSGDRAKKARSSIPGEGEIISRREKGFPGIRLSVSRSSIRVTDAIELFSGSARNGSLPLSEDKLFHSPLSINSAGNAFHSDHIKEILDSSSSSVSEIAANESEWEAMISYSRHLMGVPSDQQLLSNLKSEHFRNIYSSIQKAGDQGLTIEEVSKVLNIEGGNVAEVIVEVLEVFGRALKVNGYDSVHIVDPLYRSKYFLTSRVILNQESALLTNVEVDDGQSNQRLASHKGGDSCTLKDLVMEADSVHKVTILNLPQEVSDPTSEIQDGEVIVPSKTTTVVSSGCSDEDLPFQRHSDCIVSCKPILPWLNGDGTTNKIVYKGLVRRMLGIVMQNPGILEDDIIKRMNALNPQSCRSLLKLMIMDNHIITRKMHESTYTEPPSLLGNLLRNRFKKAKLVCREHFFANPMCTTLL